MIIYSILEDWDQQTYDIVRSEGKHTKTVQTNIRTLEKAKAALLIWRQREQEKTK